MTVFDLCRALPFEVWDISHATGDRWTFWTRAGITASRTALAAAGCTGVNVFPAPGERDIRIVGFVWKEPEATR